MNLFRQISSALHSARGALGLCAALLVCLPLAPRVANAGCGDYVFVRNAQGHLVPAGSPGMQEHGQARRPGGMCSGPNCPSYKLEESHQLLSTPVQPPCRGPNCSRRSDIPGVPIPPLPPHRTSQESSALLAAAEEGDRPAALALRATVSLEHEIHYPQSIFHPPR